MLGRPALAFPSGGLAGAAIAWALRLLAVEPRPEPPVVPAAGCFLTPPVHESCGSCMVRECLGLDTVDPSSFILGALAGLIWAAAIVTSYHVVRGLRDFQEAAARALQELPQRPRGLPPRR